MSRRKLLAKRIGLVGVSNLIVVINSIILLPILTKNLSISEYGIWTQIMVTINLIPAIALFGLPSSMVRFLASEKDQKEIRETFYSIAIIVFLAALSISILIFLLSAPLAAALFDGNTFVVRLLSPIVFVECLNSLTLNYFNALQRIKKYVALSSFRVFFQIVLIFYFVVYGYGIYGAMLGLLFTATTYFLISAAIIVYAMGITIPKFKNIGEFMAFGMPTIPGSLSSWITSSSDRYIIGLLVGTAAVGYYSPGYTLGFMVISLFIAPFSFLLPATLAKHYDEHDIDEVRAIMRYSLRYFLVLAIPSVLALSLLSRQFLTTISTQEISDNSYLITPFSALSALFLGAYVVVVQAIVLEKMMKIIGTIWIIAAVLNVSLNLIMVPFLGIMGAAITTLLAYAFIFVMAAHYSSKFLKHGFDLNFIIKSILASIPMLIFVFWIHPVGIYRLIIIAFLGALIYFSALFLLKGVRKEELIFFKEAFTS
jgi:O-antigen/teichoic acid export membrane protein